MPLHTEDCPGHAYLWRAGGVRHAENGVTVCTVCNGAVSLDD